MKTLVTAVTVDGPNPADKDNNFRYKETHEYGALPASADALWADYFAKASDFIAKHHKHDGDLTATMEWTIDGVAGKGSPMVVPNISREGLRQFQSFVVDWMRATVDGPIADHVKQHAAKGHGKP